MITPKICRLCFVLINNVISNLLRVWILKPWLSRASTLALQATDSVPGRPVKTEARTHVVTTKENNYYDPISALSEVAGGRTVYAISIHTNTDVRLRQLNQHGQVQPKSNVQLLSK